MRDQVIHAVWIVSHILRTAWVESQERSLGAALASEVKALQAELHHTQRVLSGYSSVVTACESKSSFQARVNESFIFLVLLLVALLAFNWLRGSFKSTVPPIPICGSGGSSDSDTDSAVYKRSPGPGVPKGPLRPSQLGKGRK